MFCSAGDDWFCMLQLGVMSDWCSCILQPVVTISAAAQSTLPDALKISVSMARLATGTALQALTLIASDTQARQASTASACELLLHMAAALMQHVTQQQRSPTMHVTAAEEIYIEELAVVAPCCQAVAIVARGGHLPALQQMPGEEMIVSLLQSWKSQGSIQVSHMTLHTSCGKKCTCCVA